ncbi:MAG: hypothetical protein DI587_14920 [Variovorax paradoxus]|nr:MAG: hypothetical protein DI583_14920 [Variovorax paradoxus]PZQ09696.1 MAG: hypothetical protein DI587_14920 [Variovorax paradoxus]
MTNELTMRERAAKAAGLTVDPNTKHTEKWTVRNQRGDLFDWAPWADDGDALRLGAAIAMQLQIRKQVGVDAGEAAVTAGSNHAVEAYTGDCMPAVRLAILRAAAACA